MSLSNRNISLLPSQQQEVYGRVVYRQDNTAFWDAKNILITEVLQHKTVNADYYDRITECKETHLEAITSLAHTESNPCLPTPAMS
jgi:hypothetical protein